MEIRTRTFFIYGLAGGGGKNQIKSLQKEDGQATENVPEMESLTTSFYQQLYTSEGVHDMAQVLDTVPTKVTQGMNDLLNAPYSQKEVKTPSFRCSPQKHRGPMASPLISFRIIGIHVVRM